MKKSTFLFLFVFIQYSVAFSSDFKLRQGIIIPDQVALNGNDTSEYTNTPTSVPKRFFNFGCGLGIPYGFFGMKFSVHQNYIGGSLGLGIAPLPWVPSLSGSAYVFFNKSSKNFRPKATISLSNTAFMITFNDQTTLMPIYKKVYPGVGIYVGGEYKFSAKQSFGLDFNIGYLNYFKSDSYLIDQYNNERTILENEGYTITSEIKSIGHIKFSMGMTYYFPF